jgi:hypothetical protein
MYTSVPLELELPGEVHNLFPLLFSILAVSIFSFIINSC